MKQFYILFFIVFIPFSIYGNILDVPADYQTIQEAINAAEFRDTVLVAPGIYEENLTVTPPVTVASYFLTTGNKAYMDSTVIDGQWNGPTILVEDPPRQEAIIDGFTVQHGLANFGGGISITEDAAVTVQNCHIRWNTAYDYGGGIACIDADVFLYKCIVRNNETDNGGGGAVYLRGGHSAITGCDLSFNSTDIIDGGGIFCENSSPHITNCSICYNDVDARGGGIFVTGNSRVNLKNTILYGNTPQQLWLYQENYVFVDYCDLEGGEDEITTEDLNAYVSWGDGNIDAFPLFTDRHEEFIYLSWRNFPEADNSKSPCIDSGDPESFPDPDLTRVDMGAYPFLQPAILVTSPDTVIFDTVRPGLTSWRGVNIQNAGGGILHIISQSIVPAETPFLINHGRGELELTGEDEHETWIRFFPLEAAPYEAILRIETALPDLPRVDIVLIGTSALAVPENDVEIIRDFSLTGIFPNPFNSSASVRFNLPVAGKVGFQLHSVNGEVLVEGSQYYPSSGTYSINIDGNQLPAGLYFVCLKNESDMVADKVLLMK